MYVFAFCCHTAPKTRNLPRVRQLDRQRAEAAERSVKKLRAEMDRVTNEFEQRAQESRKQIEGLRKRLKAAGLDEE